MTAGDRRRGVLIAVAGMAVLSTDSLLVRWADADGIDVVLWVGVLTAVSTFTVASVRARSTPVRLVREAGAPGLLAGVLQGATVVLFVLAVKATAVANVMVVIAATPLIAALLGWVVLRERTAPRTWGGIAVVAVGIGVVVSGSWGGGSVSGDLLALGAVTSFGAGAVVLRRHPGLDRFVVVGIGGVVMAVVAVVPAGVGGHPARTWLALVAMGAVLGPLARVLLAVAPRHLPAAEVALFAPVEVVLATLWAFLAFGEAPTARTWVGGAVILAGVLWGVWPGRGVSRASAVSG